MASFTTGKKASAALSSKKSISGTGSFSVQPRATSVVTGKPVSSFSTKPKPSSSFSEFGTVESSLKYNKPFSKPTPTPTRTIVFKQKAPEDITSKVKVFAASLTKSKGIIQKPVPVKSVVSSSSSSSGSGSSSSSGKWKGPAPKMGGGPGLSAGEKEKKGLTGSNANKYQS